MNTEQLKEYIDSKPRLALGNCGIYSLTNINEDIINCLQESVHQIKEQPLNKELAITYLILNVSYEDNHHWILFLVLRHKSKHTNIFILDSFGKHNWDLYFNKKDRKLLKNVFFTTEKDESISDSDFDFRHLSIPELKKVNRDRLSTSCQALLVLMTSLPQKHIRIGRSLHQYQAPDSINCGQFCLYILSRIYYPTDPDLIESTEDAETLVKCIIKRSLFTDPMHNELLFQSSGSSDLNGTYINTDTEKTVPNIE